jgi:hypothetical protein
VFGFGGWCVKVCDLKCNVGGVCGGRWVGGRCVGVGVGKVCVCVQVYCYSVANVGVSVCGVGAGEQ